MKFIGFKLKRNDIKVIKLCTSDGQTGEVRLDGECEAVRACYMISHEDYININDIILDYQKILFMK